MYNARHFAGQAERSEHLGRTSEAADRWRIAEIHAESVVTRHPRSKWVGEAQLVRARALVHLESWTMAAIAAEQARRVVHSEEERREAWLYLGLADVGMHQTEPAVNALDSAALTKDPKRRSEAYLARGRVLLAAGRPSDALVDLRQSRAVDAIFERARAALAEGDVDLAGSTADTVAQRVEYQEQRWLPFLDSLANHDSAAARRLTDVIVARADVRSGPKARLLLADGDRRLAAGQDSAAAARFAQIRALVPDSVESRIADLRQVRLDLRVAPTPADLAPLRRRLVIIALAGGSPTAEATDLVRLVDYSDSLAGLPGPADAWWFLRGELLRDSIGARQAAANVFGLMPAQFPDSPWTPKGILAAIALGHPAADSLRALLDARYASSPYTVAAAGGLEGADRFTVLEDSLRTTLDLLRPAAAQPGNVAGPQDDVPTRGRNPAIQRPRPQPGRPAPRPTLDP
jgi:tetratricopeptide (TPR) repeat protein